MNDTLGAVFPPRDELDVAAYDIGEVAAGYSDHRPDDPAPGPNHSPGYRWGWANCRKDVTLEADGSEAIRSAFLGMTRMPQ